MLILTPDINAVNSVEEIAALRMEYGQDDFQVSFSFTIGNFQKQSNSLKTFPFKILYIQ